MPDTRRVLITGVSRFLGAHLAAALETDPSIERIVAVGTRTPSVRLQRTDFLRADIRHGSIGRLVRTLELDTVVHAGLVVDPLGATAHEAHESNVIGTMNLLAACGGSGSPVRKLVVAASTAIYGAESADPAMWSESMHRTAPARDAFTRDLDEVESYVAAFAQRSPGTVVTVLRFADMLGRTRTTPFARLFDLPVVPTVLGFDPRLQFVHEDDCVAVLEHAVRHDRTGTFNVAGDGIVVLSQAVSMLRKRSAPVIPFALGGPTMLALNRMRPSGSPPLGLQPHLVRLLRFGRGVDTTALRDDFGVTLRYSTAAAVLDRAAHRTAPDRLGSVRESDSEEAELDRFIESRTAAWNGHRPAAKRRAAASRV